MNSREIQFYAQQALKEDAARRDITTLSLIPSGQHSSGHIVAKEDLILCGLPLAKSVFKKLDKNIQFKTRYKDGVKIKRGTKIAALRGKTRSLLMGERVALNFLGYLSGIATTTHQYVRAIRQQKAKIYDTRKTTPGLRLLEKYAVFCGGGCNHRYDLHDMVMIKDNHLAACTPNLSIAEAIRKTRRSTKKRIEVEVDTLKQFSEALSAHPDIILLDNMTVTQMRKAVIAVKRMPRARRPLLEASGGIKLLNVNKIAQTGVDRISIGSLTHSHRSVDISMDLEH